MPFFRYAKRTDFAGVLAAPYAANHSNAMELLRPQMQALYASYFSVNQLDAMFFPTTSIQAPVIDHDPQL